MIGHTVEGQQVKQENQKRIDEKREALNRRHDAASENLNRGIGAFDAFKKGVSERKKKIVDKASAGKQKVRGAVVGGYDAATGAITGGIDATRNAVVGGYDATRNAVVGGYDSARNAVTTGVDVAVGAAVGGAQAVAEGGRAVGRGIAATGNAVVETGQNIASGVQAGAEMGLDATKRAAGATVNATERLGKEVLVTIASPKTSLENGLFALEVAATKVQSEIVATGLDAKVLANRAAITALDSAGNRLQGVADRINTAGEKMQQPKAAAEARKSAPAEIAELQQLIDELRTGMWQDVMESEQQVREMRSAAEEAKIHSEHAAFLASEFKRDGEPAADSMAKSAEEYGDIAKNLNAQADQLAENSWEHTKELTNQILENQKKIDALRESMQDKKDKVKTKSGEKKKKAGKLRKLRGFFKRKSNNQEEA